MIHFIGGMDAVLNFRIYIALFVIYSQFQVCNLLLYYAVSNLIYGLKGSAVAVERIFSGGRV